MKSPRKWIVFGAAALLALVADVRIGSLWLEAVAHAVIGAPLTPVSYAGAARRTVRRTGRAYASTAATATAVAATQAAARTASQAAAQAAAPKPAPAVAVGTIVATLPPGCVSAPIGGVNYFDCGGVFYRPAFQSNNLVYVVQQP
jgi:hypothetical protein